VWLAEVKSVIDRGIAHVRVAHERLTGVCI
jgi:hypothetical protein